MLRAVLAAEMRLTMREAKPIGELETKVARAKELLAQALEKIPGALTHDRTTAAVVRPT
jgi:hypothetical protein